MGQRNILFLVFIILAFALLIFTIDDTKPLRQTPKDKPIEESRDCLDIFRGSCISCHSIMNPNQNDIITFREMFELPKDSFQLLIEAAQHNHGDYIKDSIELFNDCKHYNAYY